MSTSGTSQRAGRRAKALKFEQRHTQHKCDLCGDTAWLQGRTTQKQAINRIICRDCGLGALS